MFTGIITGIGRIAAVTPIGAGSDMRLTIATPPGWLVAGGAPALGASIACSGCCLTAVEFGPDRFSAEASAETLKLTTLGGWREGSEINLERSLRLGDEMGGHVVSGHVDGLGEVISATPEHGSTRWRFRVPTAIARFIAAKGSVAINGVSLTVNDTEGNDTDGDSFGVNIIAHTAAHTTFGTLVPGDAVNIEIDMLARYVARLREFAG
ncbi:riboflavin synthase alpha chain [Humitalea rosea]|uniref:Riboflavin synthase n=1 Tax=Humitalea rosea TaxID=990373 RepID=A0A2W7IRE2_9PROT|nr:riboflavin synthase [Humitalea rosea]PZW49036.1 riboflavin synthase alpha chain [Humitalea rosea]